MSHIGNRKALITGGASGIGKLMGELMLQKGLDTLIIWDVNETLLQTTTNDFKQRGFSVLPYVVDVMNVDAVIAAAQQVKKAVGKIDILINNAGTLVSKPFENITFDEINRIFNVNYIGPALLVKYLLPLLKAGQAHVVNITSMGGYQGSMKFKGLSHYSASKAALAVLTECLAEEYKKEGIIFNALALGAVQTEMLAEAFPNFKAPVTAEQMGEFIANFAMNGKTFFNGKVLPVALSTP